MRAYLGTLVLLAACNQPMVRDPIMTDCHDGTYCPPAYPVCTGRPKHPCEAASEPQGPTWEMRIRDASVD